MCLALDKKHFHNLTSMRFFFAILIVLFHTASNFQEQLSFLKWGGWAGNSFFFCSSGFLIAYSYKTAITERELSFGKFFLKRLIAIYPLYFITNIVSMVIGILNDASNFSVKRFFLTFTMTASGWIEDVSPFNGAGWFFNVLLVQYIIFYFLCWLQRNIPYRIYLPCLIALILVGDSLQYMKLVVPLFYRHNGEAMFGFFVGAFLCEVYVRSKIQNRRKISFVVSLMIMLLIILFVGTRYRFMMGDEVFIIQKIIVPSVLILCTFSEVFNGILYPFRKLGEFSMSICLCHLPIIKFFNLFSINYSSVKGYMVYIGVVFLISIGAYYLDKLIKGKALMNKIGEDSK